MIDSPIDSLVRYFSASPRLASVYLYGADALPPELRIVAKELLSTVPEEFISASEEYASFMGHDPRWLGLGKWVDREVCLLFRSYLTGKAPDPALELLKQQGISVDEDELALVADLPNAPHFRVGAFDAEFCRSTPAANSTYWLGQKILELKSCKIRLDPLLLTPAGGGRPFYKMLVHGQSLDWERILSLRSVERSMWLQDKSESGVATGTCTELVWKPRGDEVILEVEELPATADVDTRGARYAHGVLNRNGEVFTHLDGAIRWYTETELAARRTLTLDRAQSPGIRTKVFKLDEDMEPGAAMDHLHSFYVWNDDIQGYSASSANTERAHE